MKSQDSTAKIIELFPASIQLYWEEGQERVSVCPEDQDRFELTVEEVIKVCQLKQQFTEVKNRLKRLLTKLSNWTQSREETPLSCLTIRDDGLLYVVINLKVEYDSEIEDALTELDIEIANDNDFSEIRLNVLNLPLVSPESANAFISSERTIIISNPLEA